MLVKRLALLGPVSASTCPVVGAQRPSAIQTLIPELEGAGTAKHGEAAN